MKRVCEPGADRITNLPVDVIHRILVLLTTKDAAKMATLSTKWRGHWRTIPQLQFAFYENVLKKKLHFKCTPLLEVVSILSVHEKVDKPADMVALFATLPALKRVAIDFKILECLAAGVDNLSTGLPTPLHQLKFLHICYLDLGCSLKKARDFVCLIMSSPNLLELTIEVGLFC